MPPFTNDTIISYFFLHSRTVESVDFSSTDRRVKKILIVVASGNLKLLSNLKLIFINYNDTAFIISITLWCPHGIMKMPGSSASAN